MYLIAGVDEVGRGPLIGPVVTAAVILNPNKPIEGLMDSKKLTEKRREKLAIIIKENALYYAYGRAEASEIDQINILQASLLAMQRAVHNLPVVPNKVLVDGNRCPDLACETEAIIKGDQLIPEISAASILAKVSRDHEMILLHQEFPEYGFAQHKGYPTKAHIEAIAKYGILPIHRKTFGPVKELLNK